MDFLPTFDGHGTDGGVCNKSTADGECLKPAQHHVFWTPTLEAESYLCEEHFAEARHNWAFYAAHGIGDCLAPRAMFSAQQNTCILGPALFDQYATQQASA